NIGLIHQQREEFKAAVESYLKATEVDPKFENAWANMATAYILDNDIENGMKAAQEALKIKPDFPLAKNNLAVALYYSKDYKGAMEHAEKAKELGYPVEPKFIEAIREALG
ncbi:MAG: tetratricopeptide repeat protein, partial [Desulfobulbaceae bacterium]|nr:tetratricopeptide repeat protein [Desulfobulbaceae bacterium]